MRNDFYIGVYEDTYLAHHGILGQKWGIRRYQNYDGTLTDAGRKRYGVGERGSLKDISTPDGYNRRIKDLKKGIKINVRKRARSYTRIRDNGGLPFWNRKHARRIDECTTNIHKGQEEIAELLARAEKQGYVVKGDKVMPVENERDSFRNKAAMKKYERFEKEAGYGRHKR